jgi:hypothetical protein
VVAVHALLRAKPLRRRDLAGRRQFLRADARSPPGVLSGLGAAAPAVGLVRLTPRAAPLKGVPIRAGSFAGTAFPPTSWLADSPRPLPDDSYRLELCGLGARPLRLPAGGAQAGHARPHRRLQLAPALDGCAPRPQAQAGRPAAPASHVRVISHTGYRWSFDLRDARGLLLATSWSSPKWWDMRIIGRSRSCSRPLGGAPRGRAPAHRDARENRRRSRGRPPSRPPDGS